MAHSGAKNGPPKTNKKHEEGVVISIEVSIALSQAAYGNEKNAFQVEVKASKIFETRDHLNTKIEKVLISQLLSHTLRYLCHPIRELDVVIKCLLHLGRNGRILLDKGFSHLGHFVRETPPVVHHKRLRCIMSRECLYENSSSRVPGLNLLRIVELIANPDAIIWNVIQIVLVWALHIAAMF